MKHESELVIKYVGSIFTQTSANDGVMPLMDARARLLSCELWAAVKLTHIKYYIKSNRAWRAEAQAALEAL